MEEEIKKKEKEDANRFDQLEKRVKYLEEFKAMKENEQVSIENIGSEAQNNEDTLTPLSENSSNCQAPNPPLPTPPFGGRHYN